MRGLVEKFFHPERVKRLFEEHAVSQYMWQLPFSTVAEVLSEVVFNVSPSVGASLQNRAGTLPVSRRAFYKKLNGVEPVVGRALMSDSAAQLEPVLASLGVRTRPVLSGHRTRILDGNHFAATEHRLEVLRHDTAAPLPGQALAVLDADRRLVRDVIPCEDGHAQERSLLGQVLPLVCPNDLWLADRNFCTLGFVCGIARAKARFLIRLHAGMPYRTVQKRRQCGRTKAGKVYEERIEITDPETGRAVSCRLVTLVLDTPTRDGGEARHQPDREGRVGHSRRRTVPPTLDHRVDVPVFHGPGPNHAPELRNPHAGLPPSGGLRLLPGAAGVEPGLGATGIARRGAWRRLRETKRVGLLPVAGNLPSPPRHDDRDPRTTLDRLPHPHARRTGQTPENTRRQGQPRQIPIPPARTPNTPTQTNPLRKRPTRRHRKTPLPIGINTHVHGAGQGDPSSIAVRQLLPLAGLLLLVPFLDHER